MLSLVWDPLYDEIVDELQRENKSSDVFTIRAASLQHIVDQEHLGISISIVVKMTEDQNQCLGPVSKCKLQHSRGLGLQLR